MRFLKLVFLVLVLIIALDADISAMPKNVEKTFSEHRVEIEQEFHTQQTLVKCTGYRQLGTGFQVRGVLMSRNKKPDYFKKLYVFQKQGDQIIEAYVLELYTVKVVEDKEQDIYFEATVVDVYSNKKNPNAFPTLNKVYDVLICMSIQDILYDLSLALSEEYTVNGQFSVEIVSGGISGIQFFSEETQRMEPGPAQITFTITRSTYELFLETDTNYLVMYHFAKGLISVLSIQFVISQNSFELGTDKVQLTGIAVIGSKESIAGLHYYAIAIKRD